MGEIELLTTEQKLILDKVSATPFLTKNFYFTGGTVLSGVYLKHRISDDLDFFSEKPFDNLTTLALLTAWSSELGFKVEVRVIDRLQIFQLSFPNGVTLKVDFSHYPFKRIGKGENYHDLPIDSLWDIATNKLMAINGRTEVKDFVDLYFLLQQFTFWDLLQNVKSKFRVELEVLNTAADFLKVERFTTLPKMILPLDLETLKNFYRDLARKLGLNAVTT